MLTGAIAGLAIGGVYAILAVCVTLMATLVRVINFSQAAIGMFGAYCAVWFTMQAKLPMPLSIVLGLLIGMSLSVIIGLIISKWLGQASISARSAVTVASLLLLVSISFIMFGTKPLPFRAIVSGAAFEVAGVTVSTVTVVMVVLAILVAVLAHLLLKKTSIGTQLRAISDRPMAAELLGIPVRALTLGVWAFTGLIATIVIVIIAPVQTSDAISLSMLVLNAAAAALLGAFRRLDLALIGGLLLGMIQGATAQFAELLYVRDWIPLVLIVLFLLWNQRKEVWDEAR